MRRTIASIDTALPCSPRSRSSEIPFDVCICMEKTDKGRVDPEQDQLESPSAGRLLKRPDRSASRTGGQDESLPRAACSLAWVRIWVEFPPQNALSGREPVT